MVPLSSSRTVNLIGLPPSQRRSARAAPHGLETGQSVAALAMRGGRLTLQRTLAHCPPAALHAAGVRRMREPA